MSIIVEKEITVRQIIKERDEIVEDTKEFEYLLSRAVGVNWYKVMTDTSGSVKVSKPIKYLFDRWLILKEKENKLLAMKVNVA